jgi:hypothetical protein
VGIIKQNLDIERMTVKEVAEALDVSPRTVSKWAKILFPESIQNGKKTWLTEIQVVHIKRRMLQVNSHFGACTIVQGGFLGSTLAQERGGKLWEVI